MVDLVASRMAGVFIGLPGLLRPGEGSCALPALWASGRTRGLQEASISTG